MKNLIYIISVVLLLSGYVEPKPDSESFVGLQQIFISAMPDWSTDYKFMMKKTTEECNRYIMEVYSDPGYSMQPFIQQKTTDGNFIMTLDRNKTYYILLWADKSVSDIHTTESIKDIKLKSQQILANAFQAEFIINGTKSRYNISLQYVHKNLDSKEMDVLPRGIIAASIY